MEEFEYHLIDEKYNPKELRKNLNELGSQGWELVSTNTYLFRDCIWISVFLKKKLGMND